MFRFTRKIIQVITERPFVKTVVQCSVMACVYYYVPNFLDSIPYL